VENQDAIDTCIVGMLGDPKEVCNNPHSTKLNMNKPKEIWNS